MTEIITLWSGTEIIPEVAAVPWRGVICPCRLGDRVGREPHTGQAEGGDQGYRRHE